MLGALTSLTGGGGMSLSGGTSESGGENTFANDFNYKSGAGVPAAANTNMMLIGAVVAVVIVGALVLKKGR